MKRLTLCTAFVLIATGVLHGTFEDDFHEKLLTIGWSRCLSELDQYPADQQRIILEKALRAFGSDIPPREIERQKNFEIAQSAMISIPDHAKYYQDKIETLREQVKANENLSLEEKERLRKAGKPAVHLGDYEDVRHDAFTVLGLLPSPETVAVLGHFLEDPEGRDGQDMLGNPLVWHDDVPPAFPNCGLACIAITNLGIEHAPIDDVKKVNSVAFDPGQVDVWKDWWHEVQAGKRTYRFKGSAIEYGASGPATKEQLDKRENDRKRTEEGRQRKNGALESRSDSGRSSSTPLVALILAGLAVLGTLVWYFRRAAR